jgi:hypothetical protein
MYELRKRTPNTASVVDGTRRWSFSRHRIVDRQPLYKVSFCFSQWSSALDLPRNPEPGLERLRLPTARAPSAGNNAAAAAQNKTEPLDSALARCRRKKFFPGRNFAKPDIIGFEPLPHVGGHCVHGACNCSQRAIVATLRARIELIQPLYRSTQSWSIQLGLRFKKQAGVNSDAFAKALNVCVRWQF